MAFLTKDKNLPTSLKVLFHCSYSIKSSLTLSSRDDGNPELTASSGK